MRYKGYTATVVYDTDAEVFHGRVDGIRDVVTFQSKSLEEGEAAFRDSIDDYLAYCDERGEAPNVPGTP